MELKFDANQDFQIRAIDSVVSLLDGQPPIGVELNFTLGTALAAIPNRLDLDEASLLRNLRAIQSEQELSVDVALAPIEQRIETESGSKDVRFCNFSVEMETGTGKTYVYIRTALELFRRYGLRKFIVVVPSVAIREGVLTDLRVTQRHFEELFANLPYRYYVYDASNLSQVRAFAVSDSVELMVMTIDSFNKASNVIRQSTDHLQGQTPIHLIQAARPILILDEPQNMESELRVRALATLDPLFALRYSATHRNPYNVVYRLTPFEAYRQGLVKRIEVASVLKEDDVNQPFVRIDRIDVKKTTVTARVSLHQLMKTGAVKEKAITVRPGDALREKAARQEYDGFEVEEINPGSAFVRFANNVEIRVGESRGADKDAIFEAQIRYTVEEHFRKQARLRGDGIKVLSLFFIDRVDNYVQDDGVIRRLFIESFDSLKAQYPEWQGVDVETVQAAYFAQKRRRGGAIEFLDSVSGETKEDTAAYNLIMRAKERLLSLNEPVSFIFSHSALKEGWDNPNVFQICTLNQTASEMKKRQEVGRGVRLCRDQSGERVQDERINVLTVVANESYERYVAGLQSEIEDEYGKEGLPPKPANARKRGSARLRKQFVLKPEFRQLWDRLKHKTRYSLTIDTESFLADVVPRIDKITVRPPRVAIMKAQVRVDALRDSFDALQMSAAKTAVDLVGRYPLPNLVEIMADLMEHTTPAVRLTRSTLLEVFRRTTNKHAAMENPHDFASEAIGIVKDRLSDLLVEGIQYERVGEWYEMAQLEVEVDSWEQYLVPGAHSLYDHVVYESEIERAFVEGLERRDDVTLYWKLPAWFKVPTPVGEYNPDWAIVMEDRDAHGVPTEKPMIYLVRETKSATWQTGLRPSERRKIVCGERHFEGALGVDFKVVSSAAELP
jgi:type III restriction enzyme